MTTFNIFSDVTTTFTSDKDYSGGLDGKPNRTFQGFGDVTASTGAATIIVDGSNDNTNWIPLGTISLTLGTTTTTDGFASVASWKYIRGRVTAISGTGAKVSLIGNV